MRLVFAKRVYKDLQKIDKTTAKRIVNKLEFYAAQDSPLSFAEVLKNSPYGSHRFRVGNYRALCDVDNDTIYVTAVGHRRDIYK